MPVIGIEEYHLSQMYKNHLNYLRVGAFNIAGIGGVLSDVEELSLPD
jgi:hypothetical protein